MRQNKRNAIETLHSMFKRKKERRIYLWTWQVVEDDRDRQREKKPGRMLQKENHFKLKSILFLTAFGWP